MKAKKPAVKASKTPTGSTTRTSAAKAESAEPKPKTPRKTVRRTALPPILLEGDESTAPPVSGPGEKFTLGPTPPVEQFAPSAAELPESYGTKKLFLTARDPHWLYANWDLTREQQSDCNQESVDGHLILRILDGTDAKRTAAEIHVHPESRHWFAHVEGAGQKYAAELGYYTKTHKWVRVAKSAATFTPPETVSMDTTVEFSTISVDVPFATLLKMVKEAVTEHRPLALALEELRRTGHPELPKVGGAAGAWTPEQERALARVVSMDQVRRVWIGSLEITELIRRRLDHEISSFGVSQFGWPTSWSGAVSSFSSPFGGPPPGAKGFWFNVNAELIIYGATEPDAAVSIGGRKIKLRPDGSFAYRFALPDGNYDLPAVAVSADETDARAAELKFMRATSFHGDVGAHPQDPALKTPTPDNV
jgi:hypothetical protein